MTPWNGGRGPGREPGSDMDLDGRLVAYLRDGPQRAPEHLLGTAALRVHATPQRRRRGPLPGRMTGWAVVTAAIAVAVIASIRFGLVIGPGIAESPAPTLVTVTVGAAREPVVTQRTATPAAVLDVMVVDGTPWAVLVDGLVFEIDPVTGEVLTDLDAQLEEPTAVAMGAGAVWVGSGDGSLVKVDTTAGTIEAKVPVGIGHNAVAASDEAVWVAGSSEARRIDAATLQVVPFELPAGVLDLAAVGDDVWASYATGAIIVADGRTGAVRATLGVAPGSASSGATGGLMVAGPATIWITDPVDATTLVRFEPGPPKLAGLVRFDPPGPVTAIAADADGTWVLLAEDGLLVRLLNGTLEVADTINVGLGARGIGFVPAGLALWGAGGVRVLDVTNEE